MTETTTRYVIRAELRELADDECVSVIEWEETRPSGATYLVENGLPPRLAAGRLVDSTQRRPQLRSSEVRLERDAWEERHGRRRAWLVRGGR